MTTIWKRSLSLMLVFLMLLNGMPVGALAAELDNLSGATAIADAPGEAPPAEEALAEAEASEEEAPADEEESPANENDPMEEESPEEENNSMEEESPEEENDPVEEESPAEEDPLVAEVQAMIDALPEEIVVFEGMTQEAYEAELDALAAQLWESVEAGMYLTDEQIALIDDTKSANAQAILDAYYLADKPMAIADGSYTIPTATGSVDYKTMYSTLQGYGLAENTALGVKLGFYVGDTHINYRSSADDSFGEGTYDVYKAKQFLGKYSKDTKVATVTIVKTSAEAAIDYRTSADVLVNGHYGPKDEGLAQRIYDAIVKSCNHDGDWTVTVYDGGMLSGWRELDSYMLTTSNFAPGQTKQIRITWAASSSFPEKAIEVSDVKLVESRVAPTISISQTTFSANTQDDFEATVKAAITASAGNAEVTFPAYTFPGTVTVSAKVTDSGATWIAGGDTSFDVTGVVNTYTVTWVDGNGETLETDENVPYGATPEYNGATPTKSQTVSAVYTWDNGWTPAADAVAGNTVYTATFTETARTYQISWDIDGNGTVDKTTQEAYGTVPTAPSHADRSDENLSPNGWSPELAAVTGEATYTAQYSNDTVYIIKFIVDGNEYDVQYVNVTQQDTVKIPNAPDKEFAVFGGWDKEIAVTPDDHITYTAIWLADSNNNNVADRDETVTVTANVSGNGTVDLVANDNIVITKNDDGTWTVLYDSTVEGANVVAVTAAPNDTVSTDGSVDYLISNDTTIDLTSNPVIHAEFGTESIAVAETGTIYLNPLSGLRDGLKNKVLTAAGIDPADAAGYTVILDGTLSDYDVETDNWLEIAGLTTALEAAISNGETTFIIRKNSNPVVSDTIQTAVKDSRLILTITATPETYSKSAKEGDIEAIKAEIKGQFSIAATDPVTGTVQVVNISDSYIDWDSIAWPEDAGTGTYTVTVKVNTSANATYQNAPSASVTVTLTDTTVLYTVTYLDGYNTENNTVATYTIAENLATQTPETTPTREFYTFTDWTPKVAEKVTGNVTYTATWKPDLDNNGNSIADQEETYTVVYVLGNGEDQVTFADLAWGSSTPTIENPAWGGYNFKGWDVSPNAAVSAPASGNTITYTAQWTAAHAILFMNQGKQYDTAEVEDKQLLTEPTAPLWDDDHDFLGWYNGETKYDFTQPVTSSLTLTAKWRQDFNRNDIEDTTEAHFTVIYSVDGIETRFENILTGMLTPTMEEPTRQNYKFNGWLPEVSKTVTANATYVAQWLNDTNNNGVDDTLETITFAITGNGQVTIGQDEYANGDTLIYDSTNESYAISLKATPATTSGILTETISASYVASIAVDETAQPLTYASNYSVTSSITPAGSQTVTIVFADAGFVYNDERLLNFYPGMTGVVLDDVYNTIVDTPDLPGVYTLQYFARPASSHTVNLANLGLPDLLMTALKAIGYDTITIDMPDLWLDVEVNDLSDKIENAVSLDQACAQYLTVEKLESLVDVFNNNGGLFGGGVTAVKTELDRIISSIKDAATYYGAHSFGYNASDAETVTETIKVTYKNAGRYIEGQTDITLKDLRAPSYLMGSNVSVMYRDYTDETLAALIAPYVRNAEGAVIEGAAVTCTDIADPYTFEGKYVSDTAYALTFKFAGNETYKPSEGTFHVTVTKAPVKYDAPNVSVTYGEAYDMQGKETFALGNAYGDYTEIRDSMIQFVIGLDVAELDVDADGVTGLNGKIQIILPAELKDILDTIQSVTGGNVEEGIELSLADLLKYLDAIPTDSLTALQQALEAIQNITEASDITVTLGGTLPTATGAYLYGAVSTSANYETAFDVSYIIIKPEATQVYLDWNYTDSNGVFSYESLYFVDLGASAYNDEAFAEQNKDATALVNNVIFGVIPKVDAEGNVTAELVASLYAAGSDPEDIEAELSMGAYTQLAFVADFGNQLYYALPIVRAFVLTPNTVDVEIGDETDSNTVTFNGKTQDLNVSLTYAGDAITPDAAWLRITYTGIQTNTKTYEPSDIAPTHAGAYVVTAVYAQKDENGNVIAVGGDMEPLIIMPAESTISVTGGTYAYDGKAHGVSVESSRADITILSGYVGADPTRDGLGLADVTGTINVDAPAWVDALIAEKFPNAYANGVTKADLQRELAEYTETLLAAGVTQEMINSMTNLLKNISTDVRIFFNDVETYTEPGVYAYVGIVTDSDYMPSMDTGLVIIGKKPLVLDMVDTTVTYNGEGQFINVYSEPEMTDYVTVIVDRENNIGNILLEDDMTGLLAIIEESLGREIPKEINVGELQAALNRALTALESLEHIPTDTKAALTQIRTALAALPQTGMVYLNSQWLPTEVGTYAFYGASYSAVYQSNLTEGVLTIQPKSLTITVDEQTKVYGETDPELTYTVTGLADNDTESVLGIEISREAGENIGKYAITLTADNVNYDIDIINSTLTITAKTITAADVALDGSLVYTGSEQTQNITVAEGITYTVTGNQGTNAGSYKLTVTGTGNYTGTVELDWSIAKAAAEITVDTTPITVTYGETVVLPTATSNFGDVTCDKTPADLVDAGTYTVTYTVPGTDNYIGAAKTLTVTVKKADASIDKAPEAIENLICTGKAQALVTAGTATGGTMEYSLDGNTWSKEIPTATDAGQYTVHYRVVGDKNHNDVPGGSVKVTIEKKSVEKTIQFPSNGAVRPGDVVEIDGVNYTVDSDRKITVPQSMTGNLIITSYRINANTSAKAPAKDPHADAHKAYPQHMYVWYAEYNAADDSYLKATEIKELRDFFTYAGTSIRYSSNANEKHGIRIITSVDEDARTALIKGKLIKNKALAGWKLVEYGTVFKNSTKAALPSGTNLIYTGQSTGNASVAYGRYNGKHLDQIFNRTRGMIQFTGMLVGLENSLLDDELILRPYMVLESPDGERITIHGGSLQRNIGYVAWQNRNFNGGTGAKAFIQNIIKKVYGK